MTVQKHFPNAPVPLSVLDLAIVPTGGTGPAALRGAIANVQLAEELGFRRYWFAEHHLAAGVASAAPGVLTALAAAHTSRIRVGSGAVLLSTTSPLVAAEQFGTVAALHPGRVDLGIGRAFGPPPAGARTKGGGASSSGKKAAKLAHNVSGLHIPAPPPLNLNDSQLRERLLSQQRAVGAGRTAAPFREELQAVLALRAGHLPTSAGSYTSPPVDGADFELWPLASSGGESARVAGELGLPLAANYHVSPATILETVQTYRDSFVPGVLAAPYVLVSADVLVAPTAEDAAERAEPFGRWVLSIRAGVTGAVPYPKPGTSAPLTAAEETLVRDRLDTRFVGAADQVVSGLRALVEATEADELLITTQTWDPEHTRESHRLLAAAWGAFGARQHGEAVTTSPAPAAKA